MRQSSGAFGWRHGFATATDRVVCCFDNGLPTRTFLLTTEFMHRFVIPFVLGFVVACFVCALFVLPMYGRKRYEYGVKNGEISSKLELMKKVDEMLGDDFTRADGYNTFFEVKADGVVVVERKGVKTLRNYH